MPNHQQRWKPRGSRAYRPHRWVPALFAVPVLALLLAAAFFASTSVAYADGDSCPETGYEDRACDLHGQPWEQNIANLRDCEANETPPACGNPPARWPVAHRPVTVCSFVANHPSWMSDAQFRQAIVEAAAAWNRVEAAIGIRYLGDCTRGVRWMTDNGVNEVGFDDTRDILRGDAAGITRAITNWSPQANPTVRTIVEADIVIENTFANEPGCFATALTHEMGHMLGFGHSDVLGDLMYPSYDLANPGNCPTGPSATEQAKLRDLYGVDRAPVVTTKAPATARTGVPASATAVATDPEGGAVTFEWTQVAGPPVALTPSGASVTFTTPTTPGVVLLRVTATDVLMHPATATVAITVTTGTFGTGTISGTLPPSGFGLVVFSGGIEQQLLAASGCPVGTAAFWASDSLGGFVAYVPGTVVTAVNGAWFEQFPLGIPPNTPLLGSCRR